ncbi:MAG: methyltransferase domain-containing protein [Cellvibrionaceae bacterium]
MAVLWQKVKHGQLYEVRAAGSSVRLYSNGVFHSQWNPKKPIAGNLWDLLFLPACFLPACSLSTSDNIRVLLLGVGGGAVIRQLQHFFPDAEIVAVELEPLHIQVAKKYFGVKSCDLVWADAIGWLKTYSGEKFDLVIDDLFCHSKGEAERAIDVDDAWARQLLRVLKPAGVVAVNFGSPKELNKSALKSKMAGGYSLRHPLYENAIGVFSRKPLSLKNAHSVMQRYPSLDQRRKSCPLQVNFKKL